MLRNGLLAIGVLAQVINVEAADLVQGDRLKIGTNLVLHGNWSSIAGGDGNYLSNSYWSVISGGYSNRMVSSSHSVIGGGRENNHKSPSDYAIIAGGHSNTNNSHLATISGGANNLTDDEVEYSVIAGGIANRIQHESYASAINGGAANTIGTNSPYAWIGGGGYNTIGTNANYGSIGGGINNTNHGAWWSVIGGGNFCQTYYSAASVIGGGQLNIIHSNAPYSTIAGGAENFIYPGNHSTTIGGGVYNEIRNGVLMGTISGGLDNTIWTNSSYSTIGGGHGNNILDDSIFSTIPGGKENRVSGDYAFAAGLYAYASHNGAFVWSDSTGTQFASTNNNEFAVRSYGGVRFQTGATNGVAAGVKISPGSGTWETLSDRNAKANFKPVSSREVLAKVAALPLATWSYTTEDENVRHIGPVAQDFHAAFAVGSSDRTITTVDADGVALAAIQGLHELVKEKDAALREQQKTVNELSARLQALEKVLLNQVSAK